MEMAAGALPLAATCLLLVAISIKSSTAASGMAKPGCQETCGNLTTIPYPFGIGTTGCFYRQGFEVSCENNTAFLGNSSDGIKLYDIDLPRHQFQLNSFIATKCLNKSHGWASLSTGSLFSISSKANKLTVLGCNTLAFQVDSNNSRLGGGCYSMCASKDNMDTSGQCSGLGCCQTSIPSLTFTNVTFDDRFNNSEVGSFNPCSYAFVAARNWFKFDPSYLEGYMTFRNKYKLGKVLFCLLWLPFNAFLSFYVFTT